MVVPGAGQRLNWASIHSLPAGMCLEPAKAAKKPSKKGGGAAGRKERCTTSAVYSPAVRVIGDRPLYDKKLDAEAMEPLKLNRSATSFYDDDHMDFIVYTGTGMPAHMPQPVREKEARVEGGG
jgi:hypothetical protein